MVKLKLNGKFKESFNKPIRPSLLAVKRFLDAAPVDELFTVTELSLRVGYNEMAFRYRWAFESPVLAGYSLKTPAARYWGNPKAISEFVRQSKP